MKVPAVTTALTALVCFAPALLAQQANKPSSPPSAASTGTTASGSSASTASANAQASTRVSARENGNVAVTLPSNYSAAAKTKIMAAFATAHAMNLPDEPMQQSMAEGQAKNASDAQVAAAVQKTEARLEASQKALIRAGDANPKPDEVASAAHAIERGATQAQVSAAVQHANGNASIAATLDALAKVDGSGARAAGAAAASTVRGAAQGVTNAAGGAAAGANAAVSGAAGITGGAAGVAGSATGSLTGAVGKKP